MKKRILMLFICGMASLNGWSQTKGNQGIHYLKEQQYARAKSWFQDQLIHSPQDEQVLVGLGNTYLSLNMADSAQITFQKAVSQNPKNPFAISGLGKVALMKKDRMGAMDYFDRARRADKTNPEVYCDIAAGCMNPFGQDTASAFVYLNQGLSVNPKNSGLHLCMGNLLMLKKNFGAAANAYDRAVFFDPLSSEGYRRLGYVNTISMSYRDALAAFKKSEEIDPGQIQLYKNLGDLFYIAAKYTEGEKAYRTYLSRAEATTDDRERFAFLLFFNKKYQEASGQLEQVIAVNKDESVLLRLKGYIACETGDYKKGLEYMDQFFRVHHPDKLLATDYMYYARILHENEKDLAAIESYRKAVVLDPSKTEVYEELAKLCSGMNLHREAAAYFKKMAETGSDKLVTTFQSGKEYYFEGESWKSKSDSLMKIHQTGKSRFADSASVNKTKLLYYLLADSAFTVVNRLNPEYAGGFIWKGRIQSQINPADENDAAKLAYETALSLLLKGDPTKNRKMIIECYRYLGSWYFLTSEKCAKSDKEQSADLRSKSMGYFSKIADLDPSDAQARAVLAKMKEKKQ